MTIHAATATNSRNAKEHTREAISLRAARYAVEHLRSEIMPPSQHQCVEYVGSARKNRGASSLHAHDAVVRSQS